MSKPLQPVRGTHDLIGRDCAAYQHVVDVAARVAGCYGFAPIMTPVFENSDVFHRTLGDTSDVVSKETYSFTDRGGESITLRPEFTAGVARAFISNGLQQHVPCKYFYAGAAFRYERPQKGRMRQFHQIGVELLGAPEVQADIEIIALGAQVIAALGLSEQVTLELNSLGDGPSRAAYRTALVTYLQAHKDQLSDDSLTRLAKNPLRVLDSKAPQDKAVVANAPSMHAFFNDGANAFFAQLCAGLDALGIAYTHNPNLVRGLDYYSHTVFEFTTQALGAQNTVLAGGRYDGLIELMGGQPTAGIGFAAGVERLMALIEETNAASLPAPTRPIVLVPLGDAAEAQALHIAYRLRGAGFVIEQAYKGNMSKRLKKANQQNALAAIILGEDELKNGVASLRIFDSSEQRNVPLDDLEQALAAIRNEAL